MAQQAAGDEPCRRFKIPHLHAYEKIYIFVLQIYKFCYAGKKITNDKRDLLDNRLYSGRKNYLERMKQ
jgi:hypothetical protein